MSRAALGDRHSETVVSMDNLGAVLQDQGEIEEAKPQYREAVETSRGTTGDRHRSTLISINCLGQLLKAQGKNAEAERLLQAKGGK